LTAQQRLGSNDNRLAAVLKLPALTSSDWQTLFSEAESGNAEAQYWLGRIYALGILLPKDSEKSNYWFEKSARQGYLPAEYLVCEMRTNENRNEVEYHRCVRRAAEHGLPEAQELMGMAYDRRLWFGVKDEQAAFNWFKRAAENGDVDAEVELGRRYKDGDGVGQSYALAAEWYRKAAEHVPDLGGAGVARNELGLLYLDGLGVPKDSVQAYMWLSMSNDASDVADLRNEMAPAQLLQAQQMADAWKRQHPAPAIF